MAPNTNLEKPTGVLDENDADIHGDQIKTRPPLYTDLAFSGQIVWRNVTLFALLHIAAVHGAYLIFTGQVAFFTVLWAFSLYILGCLGITAGAHRLWSHRAYKARLPLRIFLAALQTLAFQNHIYEWCRDHRVHHKYSETDADPHNANRGFFFAHMGWLLVRKHPLVISKGRQLQITDLEQDPVVMFQKRHFLKLSFIITVAIPLLVPVYYWSESIWVSLCVSVALRYAWTLHMTWLVNSAAHMWGYRPYDETINPSENLLVAIGAIGEGWHNYHHTFPWDYKTAELGDYRFNITTAFLDLCGKLGLAYDLKTVSREVVMNRVKRTGDGTHPTWGWGDKDISTDHRDVTEIINPNHQQ